MTAPMPYDQRRRLAGPVVLIYWLMLLGGLLALSATRSDDLTTISLWVGALGGTALGQYLAIHDLRLWLAAAILALSGLYCEPLAPSGHAGTELWLTFAPAALCGFWSLRGRAALVAVWFPTVIWMLCILDHSHRSLSPDGLAAILLAALAALFVGFLAVRESRRIALWSGVGPAPLALVKPPELLRESPGRQLARVGWGLATAAIATAITVWLAPPLWQLERLAGGRSTALGRCDEPASTRIREYLDQSLGIAPSDPSADCRDGRIASSGADAGAGFTSVSAPAAATPSARSAQTSQIAAPPSQGSAPAPGTAAIATAGGGVAAAPGIGAAPAAAMPGAPVPRALPRTDAIAQPDPPPSPAIAPRFTAAAAPIDAADPALSPPALGEASVLSWLEFAILAAVIALVVRFALRPVRRLVTLRHLREPLWQETIAQRISNSWQLVLIGLRDAGWLVRAGELPRDLARRVDVAGVDRCAAILERARHGVGLDAGDVGEMQRSADAAYRAARTRITGAARALGWLRWPLA